METVGSVSNVNVYTVFLRSSLRQIIYIFYKNSSASHYQVDTNTQDSLPSTLSISWGTLSDDFKSLIIGGRELLESIKYLGLLFENRCPHTF